MYAGSHGIANGLDVILDAAKELREEVRSGEVQIRLVGDGQLKGELMQRVATEEIEGVEFEPPVSKQELPSKLSEADAFFMVLQDSPVFRWGVSPNKLFDYMLAARPIIYAVNSPYNPVEQADAGVSTLASDPIALAEAVRNLLALPRDERAAMGARARAYVEEHHAMSKLAVDLARTLREVGP
jgi:glycosyltransferase involved in cell wall biosynthesis